VIQTWSESERSYTFRAALWASKSVMVDSQGSKYKLGVGRAIDKPPFVECGKGITTYLTRHFDHVCNVVAVGGCRGEIRLG
jgi:hypothetical protein